MSLLVFITWVTIAVRGAIAIKGIVLSRRMLAIYEKDKRDLAHINGIVQLTIDSSIDVGTRMLNLFYVLAATVVFAALWQLARPVIFWWGLIGVALWMWVMWQILQIKIEHASTYKEKLARAIHALDRARELAQDRANLAAVAQQHHDDMVTIGQKIDEQGQIRKEAHVELAAKVDEGTIAAKTAVDVSNHVNEKITNLNERLVSLNERLLEEEKKG